MSHIHRHQTQGQLTSIERRVAQDDLNNIALKLEMSVVDVGSRSMLHLNCLSATPEVIVAILTESHNILTSVEHDAQLLPIQEPVGNDIIGNVQHEIAKLKAKLTRTRLIVDLDEEFRQADCTDRSTFCTRLKTRNNYVHNTLEGNVADATRRSREERLQYLRNNNVKQFIYEIDHRKL